MPDTIISVRAEARLSLRRSGPLSLLEMSAPVPDVERLKAWAHAGTDNENAELANALLFPTGANISALFANPNPYNPVYGSAEQRKSRSSFSSLAAHDTILKYIHTGEIRPVDGLESKPLEDSLLVLGGPINNLVNQAILGTGNASSFFQLFKGGRYAEGPPVRPFIQEQLQGAPPPENWKVLIGHGKDQVVVAPDEFLLLTSLPNPYQSEGRLFSVVGKSGDGVRAIKLVLSNKSLVEKLYRATKNMVAWQCFLPLSKESVLKSPRFEEFLIFEIKDDFAFKESQVYKVQYNTFGALLGHLAEGGILIKPPAEPVGKGRGWRSIEDEKTTEIGDANLARTVSDLIATNGFQTVTNEVARQLIERASPEDRALIAGMALPEHEDIFQAIMLAKREFTLRRDHFSKPPLPKLSAKQLEAVSKIAKSRPWNQRKDNSRNPFEWVRDHYSEWVGHGLLQAHLKADPSLYEAFAKRVKRLGLPDWLDVPNEGDAFLRRLADPTKQLKALVSRHVQSAIDKIDLK